MLYAGLTSLKHVATIPLNMFADQLVASGWETLKLSECIHHLGKAKVKKNRGTCCGWLRNPAHPLVIGYIANWKDPPCYQWGNPLFRLGHVQ
jgi:hypothetical protein